jgi:ubiquinone/menaquinone biosynthesis C-methylase UbiE
MNRREFYEKKIIEYIKEKKNTILVLGAGALDKEVFEKLKFSNVKFSNIQNNDNLIDLDLYNLHDLKIEDEKFDYCVAHACIHHSSKPHSAVLEMYRVSKKGILIIESTDSILSRLACKFKLSEEFEISAVKKKISFGGVDNSKIPNFVFRWTEREFYKLLNSYKPNIKHVIEYDYAHHLKFTNSIIIKTIFKIFFFFFKKQQNLFSIFINKGEKKKRFRKIH